MQQSVEIGVVCMARGTFDVAEAQRRYGAIQQQLQQLPRVRWHMVPDLVIEVEQARAAATALRAQRLDGLICISGTFHLGHLVLELNGQLGCPILLWGLDEPPPDGGKLRLNSVCGVNLDASNLYKAGVRNVCYTIGAEPDQAWIGALRARRALRDCRLGIAGHHAMGFFNLGVDELATYREVGCLVEHVELQQIFDTPVSDEQSAARRAQVSERFDCSGVTAEQVERVGLLAAKLETFLDQQGLSALALRCWPEHAATFGISPCAAMSLLQAEGRLLACEGDIDGALSMVALQAITGEPPFLADLSQVIPAEQAALLWHCGVAPCNLWDGASRLGLDTYFAGGKGVTADFVLRPGELTLLRLDSCDGVHRLWQRLAEGVPTEQTMKGTYIKARFAEPVEQVLHSVITSGLAHHVALGYGDHQQALRLLARLQGWALVP